MAQARSLGDLSIEELAAFADRTVRECGAMAILGVLILGGLSQASPVTRQTEASPVKNKKPDPDPDFMPDCEFREITHGSF